MVEAGRSRSHGRESVGLAQDRFDSRRRPRQALPCRQQQSCRTLGAAAPGIRNRHVQCGISRPSGTCRGPSGVTASSRPSRRVCRRISTDPETVRRVSFDRSASRVPTATHRSTRAPSRDRLAIPLARLACKPGAVTPAGFRCARWRPLPASRSGRAPQPSTTGTGWPCFFSRQPATRPVMHFVLRWAIRITIPNASGRADPATAKLDSTATLGGRQAALARVALRGAAMLELMQDDRTTPTVDDPRDDAAATVSADASESVGSEAREGSEPVAEQSVPDSAGVGPE